MSTRAAIVELLHAGYSDKAIERQLHVSRRRARDLRAELGLPQHKPGITPAASPEDLFWRRTQPTGDGHLLWPRYSTGRGASVRHGGRRHSVHRIAFAMAHEREPVGHVATGCGTHGCVHPRHVEDQLMRDQFRAIFGEAA
ncbi:hypothetical protein C9F11_38005 [Streptomyces sp. YIM 121038]|uniref:hypothetical protein n=1 Tax=Streptomyces sp. YIM 121038 TaxID=2136401 RepID=UPI001110C21C|nr:hypothetical protein [Streptomyces sp. YIM 121038]QCX81184.1 hypothetical protein C9F11_38005 [Streptomyces sp. YIM 121038]